MPKRRNRISEAFSPRLAAMMNSPAYRVMSLSALRVISRIEIELCHHAGRDNGKLPVTNQDFVDYGVHHASVAPAIREAEALGFIEVTERGRGGNADFRRPNLFRLTFARNAIDGEPTDEWKKIKTIEQAEEIARAARKAKDPNKVSFGQRSWRVRKAKTGTGKRAGLDTDSGAENEKSPTPESGATVSPLDTVQLSISRGGGPEVLGEGNADHHDKAA